MSPLDIPSFVPEDGVKPPTKSSAWAQKWKNRAKELDREKVSANKIALIIEIESGRKCQHQTVTGWLGRKARQKTKTKVRRRLNVKKLVSALREKAKTQLGRGKNRGVYVPCVHLINLCDRMDYLESEVKRLRLGHDPVLGKIVAMRQSLENVLADDLPAETVGVQEE